MVKNEDYLLFIYDKALKKQKLFKEEYVVSLKDLNDILKDYQNEKKKEQY